MSRRVGTPQNRVELSSVSVVRLKRGGATFEVAAYPSKVVDFRAGVETDLDEVLQVVAVFSNVSKGVSAPKKALAKAFPGKSTEEACRLILTQGALQVSAREREAKAEQLAKDVANLVAALVVDAETGARLAPDSVARLLRDDAGFAPVTTRSAKQQALDVIKVLERDHGLKRAPMELLVKCDDPDAVAEAVRAVDADVAATRSNGNLAVVAPPRCYRALVAAVAAATDGKGSVDVVERAAKVDAPPAPPKKRALACNTCGGAFPDAAAHRAHFKSDWHKHNLSRKLEGQKPVGEEEFAEAAAIAAAEA